MRKMMTLFAAGLTLATAAADASPRLSGEEKLAREIEGRVAGDPVQCVPLHQLRSSRIIDGTAIVYDTGPTIYVNRPRAGARSLDQFDTLVTRTFSSELCRSDVVQLFDSAAQMQTGLVFLGDFVPYRKARR